jgi:ABC-type transport system involved in cytochrome bd biosynthesis fused ATPase/permease subunit
VPVLARAPELGERLRIALARAFLATALLQAEADEPVPVDGAHLDEMVQRIRTVQETCGTVS